MSTIGEPSKLNNQFPSKSATIQWFNKKFCSWGRKRLAYDVDQHRLGSPAPLWRNPSAQFYKVFYTLNFISSFLFVLFFITVMVYNASIKLSIANNVNLAAANPEDLAQSDLESKCLDEIEKQTKPEFIIIGSCILLVNGK